MLGVRRLVRETGRNVGTLRDAAKVGNVRVLLSLVGPALRGYLLKRGERSRGADIPTDYQAHFNWSYGEDSSDYRKLYARAKQDQWNAATDIDWSIEVDPYRPGVELIHDR